MEKLKGLSGTDIADILMRPHVIMTQELGFESHLEGWRTSILMCTKITFLEELLVTYPAFKSDAEALDLLGSCQPSVDLFDRWWLAEEGEYTELLTSAWRT